LGIGGIHYEWRDDINIEFIVIRMTRKESRVEGAGGRGRELHGYCVLDINGTTKL
jgi:hypothetical protein